MATRSSFRYQVYGIRLRSEVRLPELASSEEETCDVRIRVGPVMRHATEEPRRGCFEADAERVFLFYEEIGALMMDRGQEIVVERADEVDEGFLRAILLGQGLGLILHQRGLLTLHASAISMRRGAVAFWGAKGAGKSTTSAALHRHGHPLVTDDVLAVDIETDEATSRPTVRPGFGRMKLRSDAARALLDSAAEELPHVYQQHKDKRLWHPDGSLAQASLPLHTIYELSFGDRIHAELIAPPDAALSMLKHSFTAGVALPTRSAARHFRQGTALLKHVPVFSLTRPRSLAALPDLVAYVEEHVENAILH